MKKKTLAIIIAAAMTMSLAGCGNGSGNEAANTSGEPVRDAEPEKAPEVKAPDEVSSGDAAGITGSDTASGKEITVWVEKIFSDDANAAVEARLKQYGTEKGVTVHVELIGATDIMTKLNATIEAGRNVPDIISSSTTKVLNYYPNIPCLDVSDLVAEINGARPYLPSALEGTQIGGIHYYVPYYSSSCMMFVRKDKMAEAGITEMPSTWEEVFAAAEAVSDPANDFYGLGMGCGENDDDDENTLRQYCWNEGGYLLDVGGNITVDNEVVKKCVSRWAGLYAAGVIPPDAVTWDAGGNNSSYLAGRTGIVFNAPTLYNAMKNDSQYAELLENTVVLAPPAGADNNVYMSYPVGYSIMNTCKDVELASDLIRYLVEKEWYDGFLAGIAPIYAPMFQDAEDNPVWTGDAVNAEVLKYVRSATGYYGYPVETIGGRAAAARHYFTFPVGKMFHQVAAGASSAEDAVKKVAGDLDDFKDQVGE